MNQHIFRVDITSPDVTREWLVQCVNRSLEKLIRRAHGAVGLAHVTKGEVQSLEIPVPPLSEQERITTRLSEQMEAVERAQVAAAERLAAAEALAAAYLREAFGDAAPFSASVVKPSEPVRDGWRWCLLTDIARLGTGHTPSRKVPEWWGGDIQWLQLPDIRAVDGRRVHNTLEQTNELGLANSASVLLPAGTVCLSRTASVGFVTIMGRDMATSQDFVNWVCSSDLDPDFLMYLFMRCRREIRDLGSGATHHSIYFETVENFSICVPPLAEQRRIVGDLSRRLAEAERLAARIREQIGAIEALPAALLREAFAAPEAQGDEEEDAPEESPASPAARPGNFFRRGAIAAYIVNRLHKVPFFGRVHLEKNLYLCEAFVGVELAGRYKREAAGPLDADFLYKLESLAAKQGWFTKHNRGAEGYFYRPGGAIEDRVQAAGRILGDRRSRLDLLLDLTSKLDTERIEIAATLFAAWNDRLIAGDPVSDQLIIEDVRERWNVSKQRFTIERLEAALRWMRDNGLVPAGIGPRTIPAAGAE